MFNNAIKLNNAKEFIMEDTSSSPFAVYTDESSVLEKRYSLPATPKACLYTLKRTNFWTSLFAS